MNTYGMIRSLTRNNYNGLDSGKNLERRLYQRENIYFHLIFSNINPDGGEISGRGVTINVCGGGALFQCWHNCLKPGMKLKMSINARTSNMNAGELIISATVIRVCEFKSLSNARNCGIAVAVKFDKRLEFDRISDA